MAPPVVGSAGRGYGLPAGRCPPASCVLCYRCDIMGRGSDTFVPAPRKERWRMRSTVLLLASAALAVLFISAIYSGPPTKAQTTAGPPNFVFILTDDMRKDDLKYMPKTLNLIGSQGMAFENAFVSTSLCCPPGPPSCVASTPIIRGFGVTVMVPIVVGKATRTT